MTRNGVTRCQHRWRGPGTGREGGRKTQPRQLGADVARAAQQLWIQGLMNLAVLPCKFTAHIDLDRAGVVDPRCMPALPWAWGAGTI